MLGRGPGARPTEKGSLGPVRPGRERFSVLAVPYRPLAIILFPGSCESLAQDINPAQARGLSK